MEEDFDTINEKECFLCFYDLHMSAASCKCSSERFSCLKHANLICSCDPDQKTIYLRYTFDELTILVDSLDGHSDALRKWASQNLGLDQEFKKDKCTPLSRIQERIQESTKSTIKIKTCSVSHDLDQMGVVKSDPHKKTSDIYPKEELVCVADRGQRCLIDLNLDSISVDDGKENKVALNVLGSKDVQNYSVSDDKKPLGFDNLVSDLDMKLSASNLDVELLNVGSVAFGKLWCNNQSIFPKGFRSRVKYFNYLNPPEMSNYISEIHDAGLIGPLFKVFLEECPSESFMDVSADKCWELVLQRLNQEMLKGCKLENDAIKPLQSISGLEMFGLLSPAIIQAIEALDPEHRCMAYWHTKFSQNSRD